MRFSFRFEVWLDKKVKASPPLSEVFHWPAEIPETPRRASFGITGGFQVDRTARTLIARSSAQTSQPASGVRTLFSGERRKIALRELYGHLLYRFRWLLLAFWLIMLVCSVPFAATVMPLLHNSGFLVSGVESSEVDHILLTRLHMPATQIFVVFQSSTATLADPTYQRQIQDTLAQVRSFAHVTTAVQGDISKDRRVTYLNVGFDQNQEAVTKNIPDLRARIARVRPGPARILLTGDAAVSNELPTAMEDDARFAELIAIPLIFLVLLLVFRTVVAGLMPIMLAGVSVPVTLALIYLLALHMDLNVFVFNVASIIGLGLAIDYSLFIIQRFREELARGETTQQAITTTLATAGEAILHSGMIVVVGFAGLLFIGIPMMSSLSIGGMLVTATALLAALTLLPACLCVLGTRINMLALPGMAVGRSRSVSQPGAVTPPTFWRRWTRLVMKRPALVIILLVELLLILGWPALSLRTRFFDASALPHASQARRGLDVLRTQFTQFNQSPVLVIVQTPDNTAMLTASHLQNLQNISHWVATLPHVTGVVSLMQPPLPPAPSAPQSGHRPPAPQAQPSLLDLYTTGAYKNNPALRQFAETYSAGDTTLMTITTNIGPGSADDQALIDHLRALPRYLTQDLHVLVGGSQAASLDSSRVLSQNFLRTFGFILLATYLLLLLTFRSILLPLKAIIMNCLSILASYGTIVFIFQQNHFARLLDFTSSGSIDCFTPILMFCVIFGLSMDYEVFLLTRMREEWLRTGDNGAAVALGLEKTGSVITSAALLLAIVCGSFIATSLIMTKEIGLGITVSVLVDASLVRCLLVPATMQLLGRWNWWFPGRASKGRARICVETEKIPAIPPPLSRAATVIPSTPRASEAEIMPASLLVEEPDQV